MFRSIRQTENHWEHACRQKEDPHRFSSATLLEPKVAPRKPAAHPPKILDGAPCSQPTRAERSLGESSHSENGSTRETKIGTEEPPAARPKNTTQTQRRQNHTPYSTASSSRVILEQLCCQTARRGAPRGYFFITIDHERATTDSRTRSIPEPKVPPRKPAARRKSPTIDSGRQARTQAPNARLGCGDWSELEPEVCPETSARQTTAIHRLPVGVNSSAETQDPSQCAPSSAKGLSGPSLLASPNPNSRPKFEMPTQQTNSSLPSPALLMCVAVAANGQSPLKLQLREGGSRRAQRRDAQPGGERGGVEGALATSRVPESSHCDRRQRLPPQWHPISN